jgi:hypothetical protein
MLIFRYNYSKTKFLYSQMKVAMQKQALYEGSAVEEEMNRRAQEA